METVCVNFDLLNETNISKTLILTHYKSYVHYIIELIPIYKHMSFTQITSVILEHLVDKDKINCSERKSQFNPIFFTER